MSPSRELRQELLRTKQYVKSRLGFQLQTDEPPHCTFCLGEYTNLSQVEHVLERITATYTPIIIDTLDIGTFSIDSHYTTIFVGIKRRGSLTELQKRTAESLFQYMKGGLLSSYMNLHHPKHSFSKQEKDDIKNYGYPYIGTNWKPHFTIATIPNSHLKSTLKDIKSKHKNYSFFLKGLSLFSYKKRWRFHKFFSLAQSGIA